MPCVLVVDDDQDLCEFLTYALTGCGVAACVATSPEQAEDYLKASYPSVALIDYQFPCGERITNLVEKLRTSFPRTKLVLITGHSSISDIAAKYGFQHWIQKPFVPEKLQELVVRLANENYPD